MSNDPINNVYLLQIIIIEHSHQYSNTCELSESVFCSCVCLHPCVMLQLHDHILTDIFSEGMCCMNVHVHILEFACVCVCVYTDTAMWWEAACLTQLRSNYYCPLPNCVVIEDMPTGCYLQLTL